MKELSYERKWPERSSPDHDFLISVMVYTDYTKHCFILGSLFWECPPSLGFTHDI
jgi:hypothetical protein